MQKGCILTGQGFRICLCPNHLGDCYTCTQEQDRHPRAIAHNERMKISLRVPASGASIFKLETMRCRSQQRNENSSLLTRRLLTPIF